MDALVGTVIKTKNGKAKVREKIGEGRQGSVYIVDYNGKRKALKWYHSNYLNDLKNPDKFYRNIENNIKKGSPCDTFLWPIDITDFSYEKFGYIMDLRPNNYKKFGDFLVLKEKFASLEARINACINMVIAFWKLHSKGYSYQDINDGNFFIDPQNGDVLICDNDNVCATGYNSGIVGKTRYMAPKVVMGKKMPDKTTDRFSLAVVLFMCLFIAHPLEGKNVTKYGLMTPVREVIAYGKEPIFIYDEENENNRPVPGLHNNVIKLWPFYPEYIQKIFRRAFDKSVLHEIKPSVLEKEWFQELVKLRSEITRCPRCGDEIFVSSITCSSCFTQNNNKKLYFQMKKFVVPVVEGNKFYQCYVSEIAEANEANADVVIGEIIPSKNTPNILGLKNLSNQTWLADFGKGFLEFEPGKTVPLADGLKMIILDNDINLIGI